MKKKTTSQKVNWRAFWKELDDWYNGQSWEKQRNKITKMLSNVLENEELAKVSMRVFTLITDFDSLTGFNCKYEKWEDQQKLIQTIIKLLT